MNESIEMSVSPITHDANGKPQVFVQFRDGNRTAEGRIPGAKILKQDGFTDREVEALEQYMKQEKATILTMAKKIDIMTAMFGEGFMRKK